ncbi:ATP-binding protein [Streptomyces albidus (ex Kaewkla and Franco 2022)]|uniref:sensor histidine kinase n=1 Tax=Streptomyces albidus (ex Kaewkla and Franco 2022) TaxID=722709 RepID=UPI0015EEFC43|nr:ATP-binding protein [Streptomyces albidus (ex Kaewkla and Franco 2022)]
MRAIRASAESWHDDEKPAPGSGPRHALRDSQAPPVPPAAGPGPGRDAGPWSFVPARLRPKSVRAKIVSLLMVPVVSLMALWGYATVTTAQNVSDLSRFKEVNATLLAPVSDYVTAVQAERSAATRYIAKPDASRLDTLNSRAGATEAAAADLRRGVNASSTDTAALSDELPARTERLTESTSELGSLRKRITGKKARWDEAYRGYSGTIDDGFAVGGALTGVRASGPREGQGSAVASEARVVQELSRAREMIAREDAVVGSSRTDGVMTQERYRTFVGSMESQRVLLDSAVGDLRSSDEAVYRTVLKGKPYRELRGMEDAIAAAGPGRAAGSEVKWDESADSVVKDLREAEKRAGTTAADKADPFAFEVLGGSGVAVVLGLIGVLLSLLISMQIGRGLVVELVGMRNSALELAGSKLPRSLRRLHAGEEVDIEAEAPVQRRGEDEIGQVGSALNAVHRAAIKAAAERAEVLSGISGVYVKLARRSQVLLHRQLGLLDAMERRVDDPRELEDLFRLDHLTTRMRRHAESLIILSGAAPVRGWRKPVPMLDVVRAAVAEVEDFTRVEVKIPEETRVAGAAVADLTHLVAELVENAVAFSPPHTKVRVRGERVGAGLALEIEDRGLGMSRETLAEANRKIAESSQVDLLDTDRLGLFVVNRLAHRRGIQVSLQRSAYGGVTAVVLIPEELLEKLEKDVPPRPAGSPEVTAASETSVLPGEAGDDPPGRAPLPAPEPASEPAPAAEDAPVLQARRNASFLGRLQTRPVYVTRSRGPAQQPPEYPSAVQDFHRPGADGRTAAPAERLSEHPAEPVQDLPAGEPAPLPRRVRQANLAPQLRDTPAHPPHTAPPNGPPPSASTAAGRSPERARATMAALRSGWLNGSGAGPRGEAHRQPPPPPASRNTETPPQGDEA